jgi:protein-L-isoaspartate(D-aspartate) O-methyltransferase
VTLTFDNDVDAAALPEILSRPAGEVAVDVPMSLSELWGGLALWLALHDPGYCTVDASWPKEDDPPVPVAAAFPSGEGQVGWSPATFDGTSLVVLARGPAGVTAHSFGEGVRSAERLVERVSQWAAFNRPGSQSLVMHVVPISAPPPADEGWIKIQKWWTSIFVRWPIADAGPSAWLRRPASRGR